MVKRFFLSIMPVAIRIIPINAKIGGIMWENNKELMVNELYAILSPGNYFYIDY